MAFELTVIQPGGTVEVIRAERRPSIEWISQLLGAPGSAIPDFTRYGYFGCSAFGVENSPHLNVDASALYFLYNQPNFDPDKALYGPVVLLQQKD